MESNKRSFQEREIQAMSIRKNKPSKLLVTIILFAESEKLSEKLTFEVMHSTEYLLT